MISEQVRATRLLAWCVAFSIMSSCTPFVSYQHLSDPNIGDVGYDLACLGGKKRSDRLLVSTAWCKNKHGGSIVNLAVEYDLIKVKGDGA